MGKARRLALIMLLVAGSLVVLAGLTLELYGATRQGPAPTAAEARLLARDYSHVLDALQWHTLQTDWRSLSPTSSIYSELETTDLWIKSNGIQAQALTVDELHLLGVAEAPDGRLSSLARLYHLVDDYHAQHGELPANAATLALAQPNPDQFIAANPFLLNLATGRLHETFTYGASAPLGIRLKPGIIRGLKTGGVNRTTDISTAWHVQLWGTELNRPLRTTQVYIH
jgi:hypothetical protein